MTATLVLAASASAAWGQAGPTTGSGGPLQQIQQLLAAEQNALDAADAPAILSSGRELGAMSLRLLGDLYAAEDRPADAGESYRRSFQVEPNVGTLMQLASMHHRADDLPATISTLQEAANLDPQSAPVHLALGTAFWEENEYGYNDDSLREFSRAQRLSPADYFANQNLGSVLSQYERYDEAAPFLKSAAVADPASPDPWQQLGMNLYTQGHLADAGDALRKAVALTGQDLSRNSYAIRRAVAVLCRIATAAGHEAEADRYAALLETVHATMVRENVSVPLTESTGLVANSSVVRVSSTGDADPASVTAHPTPEQQALEQQLKSIIAKSLNDAGTVLARGRDYAGALPLFLQASLADPELAPVMRNLGLAAFHVGDYPQAVAALTRALQQNADDAIVRGDLEQSRTLLKTATAPPKP